MADEILLAEVEGPKGTAEIFEVAKTNGASGEVEYSVVFEGERREVPRFGEAHIVANELVGIPN